MMGLITYEHFELVRVKLN